MPTDTERLDWLSRPMRFVTTRRCDLIRSDMPVERCVEFMVDGLMREVNGDTLREAIDHAMMIHERAYSWRKQS